MDLHSFIPATRLDIIWLDDLNCHGSHGSHGSYDCLRQCFNYPSDSVTCNNFEVVSLNCSMLPQL